MIAVKIPNSSPSNITNMRNIVWAGGEYAGHTEIKNIKRHVSRSIG